MKDSRQSRDAVVVTCIDSLLSPGMLWALALWTRAHVVTCSASLIVCVKGAAGGMGFTAGCCD